MTINKNGDHDHTHPLFIKAQVMKFSHLVHSKVIQKMLRAKTKSLPDCIKRLTSIQESYCNLRDVFKLNVQKATKGI